MARFEVTGGIRSCSLSYPLIYWLLLRGTKFPGQAMVRFVIAATDARFNLASTANITWKVINPLSSVCHRTHQFLMDNAGDLGYLPTLSFHIRSYRELFRRPWDRHYRRPTWPLI